MAESTTLIPEPGVIGDIGFDEITDASIASMLDAAQADMLIGVRFDPRGRVYTYVGLPGVEVGSVVLVPGNSFDPDPHPGDVVTLSPSPPPGVALKRILEVIA